MSKISGWYGVRCVFAITPGEAIATYEERVTVWRADDVDDAISQAESEAEEYADGIDAEYLGLAQAYVMADDLVAGAEVFSLMRDSTMTPDQYAASYFATGAERQTTA